MFIYYLKKKMYNNLEYNNESMAFEVAFWRVEVKTGVKILILQIMLGTHRSYQAKVGS